jgi:hypothetical protein
MLDEAVGFRHADAAQHNPRAEIVLARHSDNPGQASLLMTEA